MSSIALYLLPLLAFITGVSVLVLWVILLWDAATGLTPPPRFKKERKL